MKAVIVILANLTLLLLPSLYSIAPGNLPVSPANIIGIFRDHNNRNENTAADGSANAAEEGPVQYTPAEIDNLMKLGTKGIMEKAYVEGTIKEIVDFKEVYGNKAYVFYYNSKVEEDLQKRLATVTYGISKDKRLRNVKIFGCDISKQPGFKQLEGGVYPGREVYKHGLLTPLGGAIFSENGEIPLDAFIVSPANNEGVNNFLTVLPKWIISNLDKPLVDDVGEYVIRFDTKQESIGKVYLH